MTDDLARGDPAAVFRNSGGDHNSSKRKGCSLDSNSVLMNTTPISITPKAIQDMLDELEASKAKPVARLECSAKTSLGSFRGCKHHDSATGPEDIRCGGRNFGAGFDEILPDSKRGESKVCAPRFADFGTPPSNQNAKAIIPTLFRLCGKLSIGREDLIQN